MLCFSSLKEYFQASFLGVDQFKFFLGLSESSENETLKLTTTGATQNTQSEISDFQ